MTDNHNTPTTNHEQEHTMNDHDDIIRPLDLDGDLTELLTQLGRALAIRTEKPSERSHSPRRQSARREAARATHPRQ